MIDPKPTATALADRIKQHRLLRGLTHGQLAQMAGFHVSTYARFEDTGQASFHAVISIFDALGLRPEIDQLAIAPALPEGVVIAPRQRGQKHGQTTGSRKTSSRPRRATAAASQAPIAVHPNGTPAPATTSVAVAANRPPKASPTGQIPSDSVAAEGHTAVAETGSRPSNSSPEHGPASVQSTERTASDSSADHAPGKVQPTVATPSDTKSAAAPLSDEDAVRAEALAKIHAGLSPEVQAMLAEQEAKLAAMRARQEADLASTNAAHAEWKRQQADRHVRQMVTEIVHNGMSNDQAKQYVTREESYFEPADRAAAREQIAARLRGLTPATLAGYDLAPERYTRWRAQWNPEVGIG